MTDENLVQLQKYLEDRDYKELLEFCFEPKAWKEISKLKMKRSKMFTVLKDLKESSILEFAEGKYYAASFVKEHMT